MFRHFFVVGLVVLVATAASAQQLRLAPDDPAADHLVREALAKTPEIDAARAALEAARRRVEPARTLPDPDAFFTSQSDGARLMLSQPLPWPGKLALAGEAREVEIGALNRTALTIEARVRNAWYDLVLARAFDRLIEERRETARQIESTTRDRYAAGLAVQQDVLRAQIELARIDEMKSAQRAAIASRLAELNRLLARPQGAAIETPTELPSIALVPSTESIVASALARSPEAAAARQAIETGRLRVDLAKKNFLPDFVASVELGPMWQIGVGVSLPVWVNKRQRNQLAEAHALVDEQTAQADVVNRELEQRTRERIAQLESANDVAALYREHVIPLGELSFESALASYQAGKVPFITVFDAVNSLYSDRATWLGRLAEAAKLRVAIDEAR